MSITQAEPSVARDTPSAQSYLPIRDYAVIGDLHTVALVGKNGSIDWCCLPRIDSPSVFGALLDKQQGGFFRISINDPSCASQQIYYPDTNVLLTRFATPNGFAELTDFMPVKVGGVPELEHSLIRAILVGNGTLEITLSCRPAFNYARDSHEVSLSEGGALFRSKDLLLAFSSPVPLHEDGQGGVTATFTLNKGENACFHLKSIPDVALLPQRLGLEQYLAVFWDTLHYWHDWISQCTYQGRWREMVHRSALVLKLLTYDPTGAVVAAATTSLPETFGGVRNWDYRFTWLRDTAFTLDSLLKLGFTQEARAFMDWLNARCHELKDGGMLQPMYGINGEQDLTEITLDHLEGYVGSRPVRIGNGAYTQKQLDIYGEVMDAIYIYNRYDAISYDLWRNLLRLLDWLNEHWSERDEGIWEVRGGQQHFLHSRLMSWVAFDRAVRIARDWGWPAPLPTWEQTRTTIYEEIMQKGWHEQRQCFTQFYGSNVVDASVLLMLLTRFVGPREPRMLLTLRRIIQELSMGASILRYDPRLAADDGLEGSVEGAFSACSFWSIECLARTGQVDMARIRLEKLLSMGNHVGLYAEEIDHTGMALGNFPQAFTHLAVISACLATDQAINETLSKKGDQSHMSGFGQFPPDVYLPGLV
jgi:GH15 family glucan-1,4-alpha-glucosidase